MSAQIPLTTTTHYDMFESTWESLQGTSKAPGNYDPCKAPGNYDPFGYLIFGDNSTLLVHTIDQYAQFCGESVPIAGCMFDQHTDFFERCGEKDPAAEAVRSVCPFSLCLFHHINPPSHPNPREKLTKEHGGEVCFLPYEQFHTAEELGSIVHHGKCLEMALEDQTQGVASRRRSCGLATATARISTGGKAPSFSMAPSS
jgi:hypothetical protein